jgi:hypothetical protein
VCHCDKPRRSLLYAVSRKGRQSNHDGKRARKHSTPKSGRAALEPISVSKRLLKTHTVIAVESVYSILEKSGTGVPPSSVCHSCLLLRRCFATARARSAFALWLLQTQVLQVTRWFQVSALSDIRFWSERHARFQLKAGYSNFWRVSVC